MTEFIHYHLHEFGIRTDKKNRLGKCCNTICLSAPWFRELKEPFPLLYCCFFFVWDCFASLPVQLISVACGEFGVGWCSNSNCIQNLALQSCNFFFHLLQLVYVLVILLNMFCTQHLDNCFAMLLFLVFLYTVYLLLVISQGFDVAVQMVVFGFFFFPLVKNEGGLCRGHFGKAVFFGTGIFCQNAVDYMTTKWIVQPYKIMFFFPLNNHLELEISYIASRCPDLHNTLPVKVAFMFSVDLHNYKTIKTEWETPEDSLDTCLLIQTIQMVHSWRDTDTFCATELKTLFNVIILFLFGTMTQFVFVSK